MARPDIEVLVGVLGGGSISGESGKEISDRLKEIVNDINTKATPSVKLSVDQNHLKQQIENAIKQLPQFQIKVHANTTAGPQQKDATDVSKVEQALKRISSLKIQLLDPKNQDKHKLAEINKQLKETRDRLRQVIRESIKVKGLDATKKVYGDASQSAGVIKAQDSLRLKVAATNDQFDKQKTAAMEAFKNSGNLIKQYQSLPKEFLQTKDAEILIKTLIDAQSKMHDLLRNNASFNKNNPLGSVDAMRQVVEIYKQAEEAINKVSAAKQKQATASTNMMKYANNNILRYYKMYENVMPKDFAERVYGLYQKVADGKYAGNIKDLVKDFELLRKEGEKNGYTFESLGQKLTRVFKDKVFYGVVAAMTYQLRRAFRQIYTNVVEIDKGMTELKKITNETETTYNRFLDGAADRAKKLGATLSDTIGATSDFVRLGHDIEDASILADVALVYKNVGDGIETIDTASESIISTMQAFKIEAKDAMSIVDKFNLTGNRFAISSGGVGEAMMRSASAMAAANNTLDESIALVTAANTTAQDPEKVGTALKTISMYLRAAKTEAEEAGESTDGMAESVSKLRAEIKTLTGDKVDIMADDNTFKSTYQIIGELSKIWGQLTDITQANILEKLGGKRNANITSALIQNFEIAEKVMKTTGEAAGTALLENEKYLDSITGKISILKASYQEFSSKILDSSLVKGLLDAVTKIIDGFTALDEMTNGWLSTLILSAGAAMSIKVIFDAIKKSKLGTSIALSFADVGASFSLAAEEGKRLTGVFKSITGIKFGAVAAGVAALTALILVAVRAYKKAHPSVDALRTAYNDAQTAIDDYTVKIEKNADKIKELQKLAASGTINLVEQDELDRLEDQNELLEAQIRLEKERQELARQGIVKQEIEWLTGNTAEYEFDGEEFIGKGGIEAFEDKIEDYKNANAKFESETKKTDKLREVLNKREHVEARGHLQSLIDEGMFNSTTLEGSINSGLLSGLVEELKSSELEFDFNNIDNVLLNEIKSAMGVDGSYLSGLETAASTAYSAMDDSKRELLTHINELNPAIKEEAEILEAVTDAMNEEAMATGDAAAVQGVFENVLSKPKYAAVKQQLTQMAQSGQLTVKAFEDMMDSESRSGEALKQLVAELDNLEFETENTEILIRMFGEAIKEVVAEADFSSLLTDMEGLTEQYELLRDAKKQVSENGSVEIATLNSIAEKYGDVGKEQVGLYLSGLTSAEEMFAALEGQYNKDVKNYEKSIIAQLMISEQFCEGLTDKQKGLIDDLAESYDVDLGNFKTVEEAKLKIQAKIIQKLSENYSKYTGASLESLYESRYQLGLQKARAKTDYVRMETQEEINAVQEAIDGLLAIQRTMSELTDSVDLDAWDPSEYAKDSSSSSDSNDPWKKEAELAIKKLQHAREMDKITAEQYYSELEAINKKYYEGRVQYEEDYMELVEEIFQGRRDLHADWVADQQTIAERQALAGDVTGVRNTYQSILDESKKMIDAAIDYGLDENSGYVQELRQQAYDAGKAILDAIKGAYDDFASYADDFNMWGKLDISKLDYLEQQLKDIDKCYQDGLTSWKDYIEAHNDVAKQLYDTQKESIETIIDMTMEMIEQEADDHVEALEKEKDAYADIIEMKKKLLEDTKDEADHEKEVAEAVNEIAKLQSKISQLSLDDSREAAAKRAELEEQLAEKQQELADLQSDYAYDATVDMLDESQEAFEKEKDEEIKLAEDAVDTWVERYNIAIDRIDNDWENLYEDLEDWMSIHRDSIDGPDSLKTSWENVIALKEQYANMDIENIYDSLGDIAINPNASQDPEAQAILDRMIANSIEAKKAGTSDKYGIKGYLHQENIGLAADYEDITGQKLVYNGGWRFDNKNGEFIYDLSNISTSGGSNGDASYIDAKTKVYDQTVSVTGREAPSGKPNLKENMTNNDDVKWLQTYLKLATYFNGTPDGNFYSLTKSALQRWQKDHDLADDGIYGPATAKKMKKFHDGGEVGREGAISATEVLSILKTGEWVLEDGRQMRTKEIFDRIQETIGMAAAVNSINKIRNSVATQNSQTFAPHFEVNIQHNGQMADADAKRYGEQIANEALEKLRTAFNKRGF